MNDQKSPIPNMPSAGNSPFLGNSQPDNTSIPSSMEPQSISSESSFPEPPIVPPIQPQEQPAGPVSSSYTDIPSQESQPTEQIMTPPEEPQPLPQPTNKVRKSRVLVIVGILMIVVLALTAGYYYFFMRSDEVETSSENSPEPTEVVESIPERISYPTTNLIGQITSLVSQETYTLTGVNNITTSAGCSYNETIQIAKVVDDYSVKYSTSFANDISKEACEFEGVRVEHLELYSTVDGISYRDSLSGAFQTIDNSEIPEKMLPQKVLNSIIPYPTLMTVTDAFRNESDRDEVLAEFVTTQSNGTYTFILDSEGRIETIVYEVLTDSVSTTTNGEMTFEYVSDPIIVPVSAS